MEEVLRGPSGPLLHDPSGRSEGGNDLLHGLECGLLHADDRYRISRQLYLHISGNS
jgi:hypothetical protein